MTAFCGGVLAADSRKKNLQETFASPEAAQGKNAPGGAYSYLVKDKMIGGFALVAYPAKYGTSGIMTLIVNHDGVVYEKDLGKKTEAVVKAMTTFEPDKTWRKVEGKHLEPSVPSTGA